MRVWCLHLICVLFFLVPFQRLAAQQPEVDSLKRLLNNHLKQDTLRVNLLTAQAYAYHLINPDSTQLLGMEALRLSQKLEYEKGEADSYKMLAIAAYAQLNFDEAMINNNRALDSYIKLNDLKGQGAILNNMAIIFHDRGEYAKALLYYQKSLDVRLKIKDLIGVGACYNNMGNVNNDLGNYSEALVYLFKGLSVREKTGNKVSIANSYSNIAGVYFLLGNYDLTLSYALRGLKLNEEVGNRDGIFHSAITLGGLYHAYKKHEMAMKYYYQALNISLESGIESSISVCYYNIGEEYLTQRMFDSAETNFRRAFMYSNRMNDLEGLALCNTGFGNIRLQNNQVDAALPYLQKGLAISEQIGHKQRIAEASELLAKAWEQKGNYKEANRYLKMHMTYKDSIFNDETSKRTHQIQYDYLLDKKQKEIALLEKDKSIQEGKGRFQQLMSLTLFVVIVLLVLLLASLYRNTLKEKRVKQLLLQQKEEIEHQAKHLEELNKLKDKTFSVLSHDLRSPVNSLVSVMNLMNQDMLSPEEFNGMKGNFTRQLEALSLMLDNLLHWSKSHMQGGYEPQYSVVQLDRLVQQNFMLFREQAATKKIRLVSELTIDSLVYADRDHVDIVFRNLISNAIKFTSLGGLVTVSERMKGNSRVVSVQDNGVGMTAEEVERLFTNKPAEANYGTSGEKGTGIGLLLTQEFLQRNGGSIQVKSEPGKGTTFEVTLPISLPTT